MTEHDLADSPRLRVLVIGASGTAGKATTKALLDAGHSVTCFIRPDKNSQDDISSPTISQLPSAATVRYGDVTDVKSLYDDGFCHEQFDVLVSCLASRNGVPADAWAIDYQAHTLALAAAVEAGVKLMVLLSAICVQRPRLVFQRAKLAFEQELISSGLTYSIVRPTAFFKSLSGQVDRVKKGKPFLLFGDGTLTSCKPISDRDLGSYIAQCLTDTKRHNKILPIGGPGDAITPREQGDQLFAMTHQTPRFRKIPIALINTIRMSLEILGRVNQTCADRAEFARIAHYYATESMLVFDTKANQYDADATPSTGQDTLFEYYAQLIDGSSVVERGEHALFKGDDKSQDETQA